MLPHGQGYRLLWCLTSSLHKSKRTPHPSLMVQLQQGQAWLCHVLPVDGEATTPIGHRAKAPTTDKDEDDDSRGLPFYFSLSSFPLFFICYHCNPSPLLESYKRGGRGPSRTTNNTRTTKKVSNQRADQDSESPSPQHTPTPPFTRDLGPVPSLEKLVTPTTSTMMQSSTSSSIHWM
jgi:hypothetical protein